MQYGYDDVYRLTSETIAGAASQNGTIGYAYQIAGETSPDVINRRQIISTVNAIPQSGILYYDANDRTATDNYDDNGNTISSGGDANVYDFENHMVQHGAVTIVYDGDGNRVSETGGGATTNYLVDTLNPTGYAQVMDELQKNPEGNFAVVRSYTWGSQLIAKLESVSSTQRFYGFDGHGSVRYLTDNTGAVTDTYDYDAFGNRLVSTGSTTNNYLFAGEQFDPNLGLYYNRARYLDVQSGRFWSMDANEGSEQDPASLHKYLYAGASPVNRIDPSGHDSIAELDISSAIEETLDTISQIQKVVQIKDRITSILDIVAALKDLALVMVSNGSGGGLFGLSASLENAILDQFERNGQKALANASLGIFESVYTNIPRIAQANVTNPIKVAKLAAAFEGPGSSILFYGPGFIGVQPSLSTGLTVAGRPLKVAFQGGKSILGIGFQAEGEPAVQLFHLDLVAPFFGAGHTGPNANDLDSWMDGEWLNYQVPR